MRRSSSSLLLLALASAPPLAAQRAEVDASGATFLLVPVGGRATALGQAAVADGGTGESAFWNPAGLSRIQRAEIAVQHASTFVSENSVLSAYVPSKLLGTVGVAAYLVDYGSQDVVPGPGVPPTGRISPRNIELLASYATDVAGGLSIGLNYKLIQFRQDCSGNCGPFRGVVGTTHGIDVGVQYGFGPADALRLGATIQHAGFKLQVNNREQADPLPTRVQVGAIYRIRLPGSADGERLDARVLVDLRETWGEYGHPDARAGVELGYGELIKIRTGYAFLDGEAAGPSIGLGLRFGWLALDFARQFYASALDEPTYISVRAIL